MHTAGDERTIYTLFCTPRPPLPVTTYTFTNHHRSLGVLADKLQPTLPFPFALNHQPISFEQRKAYMEELQTGQSDEDFFCLCEVYDLLLFKPSVGDLWTKTSINSNAVFPRGRVGPLKLRSTKPSPVYFHSSLAAEVALSCAA